MGRFDLEIRAVVPDKLWEGSWEDGAVPRDRAQRVFARPEMICMYSSAIS